MEKKLVSIVIPVYNRIQYVGKAIESAQNQTYDNIEIVIVDNKSTDGSWELINKYACSDKRIRVFQNEDNIGPVRNWKRCFDESKGDFIKILWSDDWMSNSFIKDAVDIFDNETAFVLSNYAIVKGSEITFETTFKKEYESTDYIFRLLTNNSEKFPLSPGCTLFRTNDVLTGFYAEAIPNKNNLNSLTNGAGNDLLLFLNIAIRYKRIKTTSNVSNFFREHAATLSSENNIQLHYEWAKVFFIDKYYNNCLINNILKVQNFKKTLFDSTYKNLSKYLHLQLSRTNDLFELFNFFMTKEFKKFLN